MLVCHCKGLTDREVDCAIRAGAATHRDIARACGAGSVCGGCVPLIDWLLDSPRAPSAGTSTEHAAAS